MDKDKEILHRIIDNEADEQERKDAAERMESDPGLRDEMEGLTKSVLLLRDHGRREAPATFTATVMARLPRKAPTMAERLREFLFAGRVLRWNMATALATAAVLIIATIVAVPRFGRETAIQSVPPSESMVTVRLTFYAPRAQTVAVAGDFNKWRTDADEMRNTDGMWSVDLKLKPGVYTYSFIVNGASWVPDPGAESYKDDGFGSKNAVLRVAI